MEPQTKELIKEAMLKRAEPAAALRIALYESLLKEGYSETFAGYSALGMPEDDLIDAIVESMAAVQSLESPQEPNPGKQGGQNAI